MVQASCIVSDATCIDDVSYYLLKHSDDIAVMLFYDHPPNNYLYDGFYSLFQEPLTETKWEKEVKEDLHLLRVNINTGDLGDMQDILMTKTLPMVIVLDKGQKILEEKLYLDTREEILEYLTYNTDLVLRDGASQEEENKLSQMINGNINKEDPNLASIQDKSQDETNQVLQTDNEMIGHDEAVN